MKNILHTILIIALIVLLQSCAIKPIFYHSEASLPYFHNSTKTVFELIIDNNSTNSFEYGVISAKDNDTLSYVILAPSITQTVYVKELTDVNLSHAIPLLPSQVEEFIKILKSTEMMWDTKFDTKDGVSYEFLVAPEHKIVPKSENVLFWHPTFKFYYQNNKAGSLCSIIFGDGTLKYFYKIEKLSAVKELAYMLRIALKK